MKPSLANRACLAVALAALGLGLAAQAGPGAHGPNGEHLDGPSTGASVAGGLARLPDGSVNVPKAAQRRMGVRTIVAPLADAEATIELPGRVVADPNASGRVQAAHGGRIEPGPRGLPVAGQAVRQGDVLAYVRHHADPYAAGAQRAQLAEIRAQRELAERRVARLSSLEGTVPRKEIEAAQADARSLAERERSIGESLSQRETLVSPVSGVVARADVFAGQVVESKDILFEVTDPARMQVEADTVDAALPATIGGAQLAGVPGVRLELRGAARALRDGLLPITFGVRPEKAGQALPLAIGQPVTVIVSRREKVKGIVLPAESVARNPANEPVVWIKSGAERFVPQPVRLRPLDARTVVVTDGLSPDNRVVVQGAALIAQIR